VSGCIDVVTANVLCTLRAGDAVDALRGILDLEPDLVGLQEWRTRRLRLLRGTGPGRVIAPGLPAPVRTVVGPSGYLWVTSLLGDCVVGARSDRYELLSARSPVLGWFGRSDRGARPLPVLAPRFATVAVYRDRRLGRDMSVVCYHLAPGVQARGAYRSDRPLLVARHRSEVARLNRVVAAELALGRTVYEVGDSNFVGLRVDGLTSAWDGREDEPGTFGPHRKIDDVHGPGAAVAVSLLSSASDHKTVLARRQDP
jgi:hypothetical protein